MGFRSLSVEKQNVNPATLDIDVVPSIRGTHPHCITRFCQGKVHSPATAGHTRLLLRLTNPVHTNALG